MNLLVFVLVACTLQAVNLPPEMEKRRALSEMVLGKRPATEGQIQAALEAAIRDPDPHIRRNAFYIVSTILGVAAMPQTPSGYEKMATLRGVAEAVRPAARGALDDPDASVRLAALQLTVMPKVPMKPGTFLFAYEDVQLLAARFDTDSSGMVRSFAVQMLRLAPHSDDGRVRAVAGRIMLAALEDPDPYVVQYAGHMAFESKAPEALPLLIRQLQNPSHVARMGVAVGLQGYKAAAKPYLPQLEAALEKELDAATKGTLAAAIKLVREAK